MNVPSYHESLRQVLPTLDLAKLEGKSILLTGATGLIGSCLADLLLEAIEAGSNFALGLAGRSEVRLSKRFDSYKNSWIYEHFEAAEPVSLSRSYDYIVHCAGSAHPALYASCPVETIDITILGVKGVLEAIRKQGKGRLLYLSSSEVYGKRSSTEPYSEDDYEFIDPLSARSCYPMAKRLAETMCAAYADEFGVDFVVARPGHVYGPTMTDSDSRAYAQFARDVVAGRNIVMKSAGEQVRSYCYVIDCATALLAILLRGAPGEAYNVSNPLSVVTIRELAEAFAKAGGVNIVFEDPSAVESKGFNPMSSSALTSDKLEDLGWVGSFSINDGADQTICKLKKEHIS